MIKFLLLMSLNFVMFSFYGNCQSENRLIQKGNDQYNNKKFTEAERDYRESIEKKPESFTGNYNLGNALYKQKKYEDASKQYMQAAGFDSSYGNQSKSYFNLGNSLVKSEKYKEGAEAYKMALRENPTDENARYNLSYALSKMRHQEQKDKDKKDDKNKDKKDDKNKDKKENKDQQKKDDQKKQDQQKQDQKKQDQQKQEANKKPSKPKISKEDAERILEALKNDEKNLQKKKAKKYETTSGSPEKDW